MKYFYLALCTSIVVCASLVRLTYCTCNDTPQEDVRAQVIDSLRTIYTIQEGGYTPKQETIKKATVPAPKITKPKTVGKKVTFIVGDSVSYKGVLYPILTGPKGGKYFNGPNAEGVLVRKPLPKE